MSKNTAIINKKDYLEIKDLLLRLKQNRGILIKSAVIAFLAGVFIVVFTPKVYKTEVSLLAESNSNSPANGLMGQLGNLAGFDVGGLMGLDMSGSNQSALTPDLYPEVVKSTTFLIDILQEKVYLPKDDLTVSVSEYLQEHTKPSISGWPGYALSLLKSKGEKKNIPKKNEGEPLNLSQADLDLIKGLGNTIEVNIIKSEGGITGGDSKIIKVSVEQQDSYVSALLTEKVIASLKQYIIDYHTSKEKKDLAFIEARYQEAKARYFEKQEALANYDDSNVNVILASAKSRRDRLVTESTLASNLYKGLAQKREQAQILVQDKTPVFTVIEPAKVPQQKSKPKTIFTIISLTLIGLFAGTCIVLWKEFIVANDTTNMI
ncbi:GNVR domain-containing protein [Draconibacterium sp.]|uniref:GNVR domain-containing protein n=1 Tax=Draconibacterium sp. TaxID=1965318 RepID=UPI0035625AB9